MTTRVLALDDEALNYLGDLCRSMYLDGECYAFATALHEGLGWPLLGLMRGDLIRHACVEAPDGQCFDARGPIKESEFGEPFGIPAAPHNMRYVTLEELRREGEPGIAREGSVRLARKLAEALWPELPWKDSLASRVAAFCDELETLSRKHKLWLRAPYPAAWPVIAQHEDDECGYEMKPTDDAMTFIVDRYLK